MFKEFEKETKNIQAIPSFPNIFECVNYSNGADNKSIVEDLIVGFNKEVEWYERFGDNIKDYDRKSFTGCLTNRTLARPLFELCFEGEKEDPKDMFLLIKANPLFIRDTVIGVGGRIYFDGRIDYGRKYPFLDGKKINLVEADTKMISVDMYGYREYDNNFDYKKTDIQKEDFKNGCKLLGIDEKEIYEFEDEKNNPEHHLLKKLRIYKINKSKISKDPNALNVIYSNFQDLNSLDNYNKLNDYADGYYRGSKSFYWDLPFVYIKNPEADFGALLIERMKFDSLGDFELDYHFQESCFGKEEIIKEVNQFQTYSAFLCNQEERLAEFIKAY